MFDELGMKGSMGAQISYMKSMKAHGHAYGGPKCQHIETCCMLGKCQMSGACEDALFNAHTGEPIKEGDGWQIPFLPPSNGGGDE